MSAYTDRNVAEMIGMPSVGFRSDGAVVDMRRSLIPFGLSTPPGPDADANAAKYVLPWLEQTSMYLVLEWDHGTYIVTIEDGSYAKRLAYRTGNTGESGPTLCRACLDAWRAKENTHD